MLVRTSVSWAVDEHVPHVLSGSRRIGDIVERGRTQIVYSDSVVKQATVRGEQILCITARAEGTTIQAGGVQRIIAGIAKNTIIEAGGHQYVLHGGGIAEGTTIYGHQDVSDNGIAKDTTIYGRQEVCASGIAEGTIIQAGGKMTAESGSIISEIDNSGLVKLKTPDPLINTIKNYTGRSGSVLKVETLDVYPIVHPTANFPAATLEGRTVLEDGAEVKLSGLTGTLIMSDEVCSRGGVIKIDVASDLLSGGLVIIGGMVEGLVKIAITLSGAVMDIDEPTTVADFLRPYPILGISGSGFGMGRPVGEDEHQDRVLVRRRQIVRFTTEEAKAEANFEFNHLPPNYEVVEENDGYYLCLVRSKKTGMRSFGQVFKNVMRDCFSRCCGCFFNDEEKKED
jgi:autotransporter passenger strand-loop-strand repeat protein